ncbi:MAG: ABC transporter ATP-binding protein, partial [Elusimicrobiota bacterium]
QDPFGSLNTRMKIFSIISEGPFIHKISYGAALRDKAERLMEMVGLEPEYLDRYPHEFSGGQRQRLNIARALALEPEFLICDEPVSSLDVSIQAQIIKLLQKLQERLGFGCLFISHDLRVIKHISDEVAVMFAGKIVEHAKTQELYENPLHPYTKILLSSIPKFQIDEKTGDWQCLTDFFTRESFSMKETEKILGCGFYPECPDRTDKCERIVPDLIDTGPGHYIACLRVTG